MDSTHTDDIKKQVRVYIMVFVALMVLTIVTVTISSLHLSVGAAITVVTVTISSLHLSVGAAITVALVVAAIKASLVASYFMHLISEKKVIYATLILTGIFFIALMFLPISHYLDPISVK